MSLKLIYGLAGSGKTKMCYEFIDNVLENSEENIIYLVPEHLSLVAEQTVANRYDYGKMSRIDVLSFERLAQSVFAKVGPVGCEYLDDTGKNIIMRNVLEKNSKKLTILGKAASRIDFSKIMVQTISELKKHGITSDLLKQAADESTNIMFKFKAADIALVYEKYNEFFKLPVADTDDDLLRLNERIDKFNLFRDCHIIVDGFLTLTLSQISVLKKLMTVAKSVTVTLTCDSLQSDNMGIFQKAQRLADYLIEAAVDAKTEVFPNTYTGECKRYANNCELAHLEKNYNTYPHVAYEENTENIVLLKGSNYTAETDLVAMEILRLCREEGYRFRDISVATKDTDLYFPIIRSLFDEYNIPYHIDESLNVLKSSYSQALLSVFEIIIYNFNVNSISRWIKSPLSPISKDDAFLLENYIVANGSSKTMWEKEVWNYSGNDFSEFEMERINHAKNKVITPVFNFISNFHGRKKTEEIASAYKAFIEEINAEKKAIYKAEEMRDQGSLYESENIVAVYNSIINTVNEIVRIAGDKACTFDSFYDMLVSGLEGCGIGQVPATVDCVEVSIIDRLQSGGSKCLFIVGVNDGVLPSGYIDDGLLSAEDRNAILTVSGIKMDNGIDKHAAEEFVIYNSLATPEDKLYLSYSTSNREGKGIMPSVIINRISTIFTNVKQLSDIYTEKDEIRLVEGVIPAFNKMMQKEGELWDTVRHWYRENKPELYEMYKKTVEYTNLPEKLYEENVRLVYGDEMYSSVSKAEQFANCGFAFFLRYGLRAKERSENGLKVTDVGTFMHAVIEEFSKFAVQFGWDKITKDICNAKSEEITTRVITEGMSPDFFESERNSYSIKKFVHTMSVTLWNITEYYCKSSFKTLGYEIGFGGDGEYPPIEITLKSGEKVKLTGKVDRADILRRPDGSFVSVVDYKSSAKNIELEKVLCGIQIQLPVYIDAICKSISTNEPKVIPAAMHYYHISAPMHNRRSATDEEIADSIRSDLRMKGYALDVEAVQQGMNSMFVVKKTADTDEFEKIIKTAYRQLSKTLEKIRSGDISIKPIRYGERSACTFCPYSAVCCFEDGILGNEFECINKIEIEEFLEHVNSVD